MPSGPTASTIDQYLEGFPPSTREVLEQIRQLIVSAAPDATETISYAIPTFDLNGRHLVFFAGYDKHVSLYPVPRGDEAFQAQIAPYQAGKGTLRFPLDRPLPLELLGQVVALRLEENAREGSK